MDDDAEPVERFRALVHDLRYSSFHDREDPMARAIHGGMTKTIGASCLFPKDRNNDIEFYDIGLSGPRGPNRGLSFKDC
jgi:hypothetical protein